MTWIRFEGRNRQNGSVGYCWKEIKLESGVIYTMQEDRDTAVLQAAKLILPSELKWTAQASDAEMEITGVFVAYKIQGGTYYDSRTPDLVIRALEDARIYGYRIHISVGDPDTGQDWHEAYHCEGYIGRSMGPVKSPLLLYNSRTMGGPAILDHCIVKIRRTGKNGRVLYKHPQYKAKTFEIGKGDHPDYPVAVLANGELQANFKTKEKAERYIAKVS